MTLSVPLSPAAETALQQRAAAAGKDPAIVASELLTQILTHRGGLTQERLREISGSTHDQFRASGMTDDQLGEELEEIKHRARAARRGIPFRE